MPTIAHIEHPSLRRLESKSTEIGPSDTTRVAEDLRAAVAACADLDRRAGHTAVEVLRGSAALAIRALPSGHPLAGADVAHDPAAPLLRLAVRVLRDLEQAATDEVGRVTPS